MLGILLNQSSEENSNLSEDDLGTFQNMALIVCGTGLVFTAIFHLGVTEKKPEEKTVEEDATEVDTKESKLKRDLTPMDWLKRPDLYSTKLEN